MRSIKTCRCLPETPPLLLYGWRKAGRPEESALVQSAAKKGAGDGGREERRTEEPHLELKPRRARVPGAPGRRRAERQPGSRGYSGSGVRASRASGDGWGSKSGSGGRWCPEPLCAPGPARPAIGPAGVGCGGPGVAHCFVYSQGRTGWIKPYNYQGLPCWSCSGSVAC